MTVKDRVGRVRYVAFRIHGGPLRRDAMSGLLPASAKLTRFDGAYGIARTGHLDRDNLLLLLRGVARVGEREVRVEPLVTSGTIRKAAEALPPESEASKRVRPDRKARGSETRGKGAKPEAHGEGVRREAKEQPKGGD